MFLENSFFERDNPVQIAKELIGNKISTNIQGKFCAGIITECEAYWAPEDQASHARNNHKTPRNVIMFSRSATAYVYICYGIHRLFNIITGPEGMAHAILIRAIQPLEGIEIMLQRRSKIKMDHTLTSGPGSVSQALGIEMAHNGLYLQDKSSPIHIQPGIKIEESNILATTRIGVEGAGDSAKLLYRFILMGNPFISSKSHSNKFLTATKKTKETM